MFVDRNIIILYNILIFHKYAANIIFTDNEFYTIHCFTAQFESSYTVKNLKITSVCNLVPIPS